MPYWDHPQDNATRIGWRFACGPLDLSAPSCFATAPPRGHAPEMDGVRVAAELRSLRSLRPLPPFPALPPATCLRRAPPPARVRGWTRPPLPGSLLNCSRRGAAAPSLRSESREVPRVKVQKWPKMNFHRGPEGGESAKSAENALSRSRIDLCRLEIRAKGGGYGQDLRPEPASRGKTTVRASTRFRA